MTATLTRLGSELGGWTVDLAAIPEEGTVIDAGLGFDTSFPEELMKLRPNLTLALIDPVAESVTRAAERLGDKHMRLTKAVSNVTGTARFYALHQHSSSLNPLNRNVNRKVFEMVHTVSLLQLVETLHPVFMKLALEGAEFSCYRQAFGVKQVAIEFHHRNIRGMVDDLATQLAVREFKAAGYTVIHKSPHDQYTFLRR